ncbi:MAG TPA: hypothetical protein VIQ11_05955 [Mycobacterium sp.]
MDAKKERWAAVGTGAVIVAVMAGTWLMCESALAWRDTFRLEDLTYARNQVDAFEAYRSGGVFESGTAWAALTMVLIAMVLAAVAGVCVGRWRLTFAAVSVACLMAFVAAGTVLPIGPLVLLICALPATAAVRSLSRSSNEHSAETEMRGL